MFVRIFSSRRVPIYCVNLVLVSSNDPFVMLGPLRVFFVTLVTVFTCYFRAIKMTNITRIVYSSIERLQRKRQLHLVLVKLQYFPYSCIRPAIVNQDCVENHFCQVRSCSGQNNNPTYNQQQSTQNSIQFGQTVDSRKSNVGLTSITDPTCCLYILKIYFLKYPSPFKNYPYLDNHADNNYAQRRVE